MTNRRNPPSKRNYRREYDTYHGTPEQKKKRAQRNAARAEVEKAVGKLPPTKEVNHKNRIAKGGTNTKKNLEVVSRARNRAWRRGKKGYD